MPSNKNDFRFKLLYVLFNLYSYNMFMWSWSGHGLNNYPVVYQYFSTTNAIKCDKRTVRPNLNINIEDYKKLIKINTFNDKIIINTHRNRPFSMS